MAVFSSPHTPSTIKYLRQLPNGQTWLVHGFVDCTEWCKLCLPQEEYLDALNEQEIVEKQLNGLIKQRDALAVELRATATKSKQLQDLYQEQDDLLAGIFNGRYGSALENKLEMELDTLLDRKQRIGVARIKWQNGRVLLQHAVNQLAFATRRWQELLQVRPEWVSSSLLVPLYEATVLLHLIPVTWLPPSPLTCFVLFCKQQHTAALYHGNRNSQ